jgi:hypothetical protein
VDGQVSVLSYKKDSRTGRVILCGSHPEEVGEGERLDFMCAMVRYALAGNGTRCVKGTLLNQEPRRMVCKTSDRDPDHTRIGDLQYHYFVLNIPKGIHEVKIRLSPVSGYGDYDLYLCADYSEFPVLSQAQYRNVLAGCEKTLTIPDPEQDRIFVAVYCATSVDTQKTASGYRYVGRTDVLNGVPYIITAEF